MSRAFRLTFGPFDVGLMDTADPAALPPGAMQVAENIDLSDGTLRGIYGPGPIVATQEDVQAEDIKSLFWVADYKWIANSGDLRALNDFDTTRGRITFVTSNGGPLYLYYVSGSSLVTQEGVGIPTPSGTLIVVPGPGTAQVNKRYAVTGFRADGTESNPIFSDPIDSLTSVGVAVPVIAGDDVTGRRLWSTENVPAGDTPPPEMYLLAQYGTNSTSASFLDNDVPPDLTYPLTWKAGGGAAVPTFQFDHSPDPGTVTVIADGVLPTVSTLGGNAGGIQFKASENRMAWTAPADYSYTPLVNAWTTPEKVEAISIGAAQAFVWTSASVYSLSGGDDTYIAPDKLVAAAGCVLKAGKTVTPTPYGHVYFSRQGLMILRGQESVRLAGDRLGIAFWTGLDSLDGNDQVAFCGSWYGQVYRLSHDDGHVLLDCTHWPSVRVSTSDVIVTAWHTIAFSATSGNYGPGQYMALRDDRDEADCSYIRTWMPDRADARGERLVLHYRSPRIDAASQGGAGRQKVFRRLTLNRNAIGDVVLKVRYDGTEVLERTLTPGVGPGKSWSQLPSGYAEYIEVEFTGIAAEDGASAVEIYSFDIEGVVP